MSACTTRSTFARAKPVLRISPVPAQLLFGMMGAVLALGLAACAVSPGYEVGFALDDTKASATRIRASVRSTVRQEHRLAFAADSQGLRSASWAVSPGQAVAISDRAYALRPEAGSPILILVDQDAQSRDRVYPSMIAVEPGAVINLDYWLPEAADAGLAAYATGGARFVGAGCRTMDRLRVRPGRDRIPPTRGRYLYVGSAAHCIVRDGTAFVSSRELPQWIFRTVAATLGRSLSELSERLEVDHIGHPLVIIQADLSSELQPRFRGDVGWNDTMFLRFSGSPWRERNEGAEETISRLVAHEAVHFWIGQRFRLRDEGSSGWLVEGAADYLSFLIAHRNALPSSAVTLNEVSTRLNGCNDALGSRPIGSGAAIGGRAAYDCGFVVQWLADVVGRASGDFSIWRRWSATLARARNRSISFGDFLESDDRGMLHADLSSFINAAQTVSRNQAIANSLTATRIRLSTEFDRSPEKIRETVLLHLLGQVCSSGPIGFTSYGEFLTLDTGNRCGDLSGDPRIRFVGGADLVRAPEAAFEVIRRACEERRSIPFADDLGRTVGSIRCTSALPELPTRAHLSETAR